MVFSLFSSSETTAELIARRSYGRAASLLREQLQESPGNASLELQLADVLVLDGRQAEAVPLLLGIANGYAQGGFLGKAIAVLKKIQRIDPSRADDVERRVSDLARAHDQELARTRAIRHTFQGRGRTAAAPAPAAPRPEEEKEEERENEQAKPAPPEPAPAPSPRVAAPAPDEFEVEVDLEGEEAPGEAGESGNGNGLEKTPLFSGLDRDELVAVIRGLELRTFAPGDVIVAEGEPGDSVFVLASGSVKAFCKDPNGRYRKVREMDEGGFFGEVSLLTGMPRSATIVAAAQVELLELDGATLERIVERHPNVELVLREQFEHRLASPDELRIRMGRTGPAPA